jgi:hypothetical protein
MKTYCKSFFVAVITAFFIHTAQSQSITFDFDNAPQHAPLPLDLTAGGITGHFSSGSPFYNYSIQSADVLGFTPPGFSGLCIFPSTVFQSDLLVSFDTPLTSASILYAPEEYGTDSSCTMRMTAYLGTTYIGTNTYQIPNPGTWPSGTLSFSSTSPFDNIVIHYDAPPPTGGDYGPIFMADNLVVTPSAVTTTTLHVVGVAPRYQLQGGSNRVGTQVAIQDASNLPVSGATVALDVTAPNGKRNVVQGTTDASGKMRVSVVTRLHGTFTFCVTDVTKTDYAYDPTQNVETCDSVIVP